MKRLHYAEKGDILLEALIGILIMTFLGLGLAYTAGQAIIVKKNVNTQNISIVEMREAVTTNGITSLCSKGNSNINVGEQSLQISSECSSNNIIASVNGNFQYTITGSNEMNKFTLTTENNDKTQKLFGSSGAITLGK